MHESIDVYGEWLKTMHLFYSLDGKIPTNPHCCSLDDLLPLYYVLLLLRVGESVGKQAAAYTKQSAVDGAIVTGCGFVICGRLVSREKWRGIPHTHPEDDMTRKDVILTRKISTSCKPSGQTRR
eukprot:scaffold1072_cov125-Skeletonema_dohrnii-CCMP3373.AAC.5